MPIELWTSSQKFGGSKNPHARVTKSTTRVEDRDTREQDKRSETGILFHKFKYGDYVVCLAKSKTKLCCVVCDEYCWRGLTKSANA